MPVYFRAMSTPRRTLVLLCFSILCALPQAFGQFGPLRPILLHDRFAPDEEKDWAIYVDLDNDGHEDILRKGSSLARTLVWQRWTSSGFTPSEAIGDTVDYVLYIFADDLDGNGWIDVVVPTSFGFHLIMNDGSGLFNDNRWLAEDMMVGGHTGFGDLNNDGYADLFCATESLHAWLNNGDGTFQAPVLSAVDLMHPPTDVLDIDGDGTQDLVAMNPGYHAPSWYRNQGDGTFGPVIVLDQALEAYRSAFKDITGDGTPELVFQLPFTSDINALVNNGDGTFQGPIVLSAFDGVRALALDEADVDGDGDPDVLTDQAVMLNDNGSWVEAQPYYGGSRTITDRFMDVDADGAPDVLCKNTNGGMTWYRNLGSGSFEAELGQGTAIYPDRNIPAYMQVLDMDADGDVDIVLPNAIGPEVRCWLRNDGTGHLGSPLPLSETSVFHSSQRMADLDTDGLPDIVTLEGWYRNLGEGLFDPLITGLPVFYAESELLDLDGDGDIDILQSTSTMFVNDGSANFTSQGGIPTGIRRPSDLDGDGDLDLFVINNGTLKVYMQEPALTFTAVPGASGSMPSIMYVDDSLIVTLSGTRSYHPSTGAFDPLVPFPSGVTNPVGLFDLTGDGRKELLFILGGDGVHNELGWMERLGPAAFGPVVPFVSDVPGFPWYFAHDLDGDALPDLVIHGGSRQVVAWQRNGGEGSRSLSGDVFLDIDGNGVRSAGEPGLAHIYPVGIGDAGWPAWPNISGRYVIHANSGTHTAQVALPDYWTSSPQTHTAQLDDAHPHVDGLDFAVTPARDTTIFEVWSNFSNLSCLTAGNAVWLMDHITHFGANNLGTTLPSCRLALVLSEGLEFTGTDTEPAVSGDTLFWSFNAPYFGQSFQVGGHLSFTGTDPDISAQVLLFVTGSNGSDSLVDTAEWNALFLCSYDPNDKSVTPAGTGPLHVVDHDIERLTYTVRFQNTGNAPAYDVVIRDVLSGHLDHTSLHVLASSHTLSDVHIEGAGEAVFRFDGIQLPDSVSDEPGSHGFVVFSIAPHRDLPNGTAIENSVAIHFDFNEPVITNTTLTTLVDCGLFSATITAGNASLLASEGVAYQWFLDGDPIPGATEQTILPDWSAPGVYTVAVTSVYGCVAVSDPYTMLPDGIADQDRPRFVLQPNPATDQVRLLADRVLQAEDRVLLMDLHGRVLRSVRGGGLRELVLARDGLAAGVYLVELRRAGTAVGRVRVVWR